MRVVSIAIVTRLDCLLQLIEEAVFGLLVYKRVLGHQARRFGYPNHHRGVSQKRVSQDTSVFFCLIRKEHLFAARSDRCLLPVGRIRLVKFLRVI